MSWEQVLDLYGGMIEERLKGYLAEATAAATLYHPLVGEVYRSLSDLVLRRGKRLASCSTLLTYKGYRGGVDEGILMACMGMEIYRHSILVHDDLVDGDALRRGGSTLHVALSKEHGEQFGEAASVFSGDMLYALALQTILDADFSGEKLLAVTRLFAEGYRAVNESQMLDLAFEEREPCVEEWYAMASRRAASLFKIAILSGATLGDAPREDLSILGEAAANIGYSFDIQDDIIDMFASEEQYGRPPGGDLLRGKKPLHIVYTLRDAGAEQRKLLLKSAGRGGLTPQDLEAAREIVRRRGLQPAKEKSREHAERAKSLIAQTRMSEETKGFFASFIVYVEQSLDWYR